MLTTPMEIVDRILEQYIHFAIRCIHPTIPANSTYISSFLETLDVTRYRELLQKQSLVRLKTLYYFFNEAHYSSIQNHILHDWIVKDIQNQLTFKNNWQRYSHHYGYLAVDRDTFSFCLATLKHIVYIPEDIHWVPKLQFYIRDMHITLLYVEGNKIVQYLRSQLSMSVFTLVYKKKVPFCDVCGKNFCAVHRINFYLWERHKLVSHYDCKTII